MVNDIDSDTDGETQPCPNRVDGHRCGEPKRDDNTCSACDHPDACASMQPGSSDRDCNCGAAARVERKREGAIADHLAGQARVMGLAIEAALDANRLLNGPCDEEDIEDETKESVAPSMRDLMAGLPGEMAAKIRRAA